VSIITNQTGRIVGFKKRRKTHGNHCNKATFITRMLINEFESNHKKDTPVPLYIVLIISLEKVWIGINLLMHILRSYTATVYSFISIGSSLNGKLCLRKIWTDRQNDFYIPVQCIMRCGG